MLKTWKGRPDSRPRGAGMRLAPIPSSGRPQSVYHTTCIAKAHTPQPRQPAGAAAGGAPALVLAPRPAQSLAPERLQGPCICACLSDITGLERCTIWRRWLWIWHRSLWRAQRHGPCWRMAPPPPPTAFLRQFSRHLYDKWPSGSVPTAPSGHHVTKASCGAQPTCLHTASRSIGHRRETGSVQEDGNQEAR